MEMNPHVVFTFNFLNSEVAVTYSVVIQWVMMIIITILAIVLTRNLKKIPNKKQTILEMVVQAVNGLVVSNMGPEYKKFFVPYIGAMGVFFTFLNLSGLVGLEPSTKDINVTLTFALMTFVIINTNAIMKMGIGGYMKGFIKPYPAMLPLNLIEKLTIPFSLCLRLFCNMLVGAMVLGLIYSAQSWTSFVLPIPVHAFFDIFDGLIQVFVFMMLTMVYTKIGATH